mgnify:CR=1 FL=1
MRSKFYLDNATPLEISYSLLCANIDEELNKDDFMERFNSKNYTVGTKYHDNFRRLVDLGAFSEKTVKGDARKYYTLTPLGEKLKNVLYFSEDLFYEVLHYLHYYFSLDCYTREYFWTYKFICDNIYRLEDLSSANQILNPLIEELQTKFNKTRIAIDGRSIYKAINMLKALNKLSPIQENQVVPRKVLLDPQLLLVAIDYAYRICELNYGIPLVLTQNVKETLCQFCFLDKSSLDQYLEHLISKLFIRNNFGVAGQAIILDQGFDIGNWLEERFS